MTDLFQFGIDLGTTNSCIARFEGGEVRVFPNNDMSLVTPSAVWIRRDGRRQVGRRAYAMLGEAPDDVALEFKRWMGQRDRVAFPAARLQLSAEELSAEVLRALKDDVRRATKPELELDAAIVTVPAAFGTLQCEATARAAALAGIAECHLLQEPIAAAVAYGAKQAGDGERSLVFDLGGGTLDVAVVSFRDGRLSVLEHRGDNQLGGKDLDLAILEEIVLPALSKRHRLPDREATAAWKSLVQRLRPEVEAEKIRLSSVERTEIVLTGTAKDLDAEPIDDTVPLERRQIEDLFRPALDRALRLAREALNAAGLTPPEVSRILLVGGPTQMPLVRRALEERLGIAVDCSQDPMTVVARGAALYASGIERRGNVRPAPASGASGSRGGATLRLAFDPVCPSKTAAVSGRVEGARSHEVTELRLATADGSWSSGWIPIREACFDAEVPLAPGRTTECWIYARDRRGSHVDVEPEAFSIRQGLAVDAPPLPKSLWIELEEPSGKSKLESLILRGAHLPAEVKRTYRTVRPGLRASDGDVFVIKIFEGETGEIHADEWVGSVHLRASDLPRALPAGSDVDLTVRVDASRLISVTADIPKLDMQTEKQLWAPDEQEMTSIVESMDQVVDGLQDEINEIEGSGADPEAVEAVRRELDELDDTLARDGVVARQEPDRARRLVEASRRVQAQIAGLRSGVARTTGPTAAREELEASLESARQGVQASGTEAERREFAMLEREARRAIDSKDERGIKRAQEALSDLYRRIAMRQPAFWREILGNIRHAAFRAPERAQALLHEADEAVRGGDGDALQGAVRGLLGLLPPGASERAEQGALKPGLRR